MQATTKFQGSCTTYRDHTVLKWGDFKRTVPHNASNVATFNLAPGYSHFQSFCATAGLEREDSLPQCYSIRVDQELALREVAKEQRESMLKTNDAEPKQTDFGFEGPEQAENFAQELEEDPPSRVEAEFLHYHQRFGHVSAHPRNGAPGDPPSTPGNMPHPGLYGMPLWQGHQEALAL